MGSSRRSEHSPPPAALKGVIRHAVPRFPGRDRRGRHRDAHRRRRPRRPGPHGVGRHRLHAGHRLLDPRLGQARRPVPPQDGLPHLDRALPGRLRAVRRRPLDELADRFPRPPGAGRRRPGRRRVRPDRRPAPAARTRPIPGPGRRRHGRRPARRPAGRRLRHRPPRLALGLLRQRARRPGLRRLVLGHAARARPRTPGQGRRRLAGHRPPHRRRLRLRHGRDLGGQRLRLGGVADRQPGRPRARPARRLRRERAPRPRATDAPAHPPGPPQLPARRRAAHPSAASPSSAPPSTCRSTSRSSSRPRPPTPACSCCR